MGAVLADSEQCAVEELLASVSVVDAATGWWGGSHGLTLPVRVICVLTTQEFRSDLRHTPRMKKTSLCSAIIFSSLLVGVTACGDSRSESSGDSKSGASSTVAATASSGNSSGSGDAPSGDAKYGWCGKVSLEQFQKLFGTKYTELSPSGGSNNCKVGAKGNSQGENITITNYTAGGYGETYEQATTREKQYSACPEANKAVTGVGTEALYLGFCRPNVISNHTLIINANGQHIRLDAQQVTAEGSASALDVLTQIAKDNL